MSSLELLSFLQKTPLLSSEIWSVYDPEMRLRSCAFDECHPEDINVLENLYCIFWNIIEENRDEYIATFTHIRNQLDDETEDLCQPAENHISFLQNLSIDPNFERLPELNIAIQCQESYCFAETYKMFSELNAFDLLIMQYYSEQHPLYSLMQEVDSIEEDLELEKILTDIKECKDSFYNLYTRIKTFISKNSLKLLKEYYETAIDLNAHVMTNYSLALSDRTVQSQPTHLENQYQEIIEDLFFNQSTQENNIKSYFSSSASDLVEIEGTTLDQIKPILSDLKKAFSKVEHAAYIHEINITSRELIKIIDNQKCDAPLILNDKEFLTYNWLKEEEQFKKDFALDPDDAVYFKANCILRNLQNAKLALSSKPIQKNNLAHAKKPSLKDQLLASSTDLLVNQILDYQTNSEVMSPELYDRMMTFMSRIGSDLTKDFRADLIQLLLDCDSDAKTMREEFLAANKPSNKNSNDNNDATTLLDLDHLPLDQILSHWEVSNNDNQACKNIRHFCESISRDLDVLKINPEIAELYHAAQSFLDQKTSMSSDLKMQNELQLTQSIDLFLDRQLPIFAKRAIAEIKISCTPDELLTITKKLDWKENILQSFTQPRKVSNFIEKIKDVLSTQVFDLKNALLKMMPFYNDKAQVKITDTPAQTSAQIVKNNPILKDCINISAERREKNTNAFVQLCHLGIKQFYKLNDLIQRPLNNSQYQDLKKHTPTYLIDTLTPSNVESYNKKILSLQALTEAIFASKHFSFSTLLQARPFWYEQLMALIAEQRLSPRHNDLANQHSDFTIASIELEKELIHAYGPLEKIDIPKTLMGTALRLPMHLIQPGMYDSANAVYKGDWIEYDAAFIKGNIATFTPIISQIEYYKARDYFDRTYHNNLMNIDGFKHVNHRHIDNLIQKNEAIGGWLFAATLIYAARHYTLKSLKLTKPHEYRDMAFHIIHMALDGPAQTFHDLLAPGTYSRDIWNHIVHAQSSQGYTALQDSLFALFDMIKKNSISLAAAHFYIDHVQETDDYKIVYSWIQKEYDAALETVLTALSVTNNNQADSATWREEEASVLLTRRNTLPFFSEHPPFAPKCRIQIGSDIIYPQNDPALIHKTLTFSALTRKTKLPDDAFAVPQKRPKN